MPGLVQRWQNFIYKMRIIQCVSLSLSGLNKLLSLKYTGTPLEAKVYTFACREGGEVGRRKPCTCQTSASLT